MKIENLEEIIQVISKDYPEDIRWIILEKDDHISIKLIWEYSGSKYGTHISLTEDLIPNLEILLRDNFDILIEIVRGRHG